MTDADKIAAAILATKCVESNPTMRQQKGGPKMHAKSESELRTLARECIKDQGGDADEAFLIFRDEAIARYSADDDGPRDDYYEDATEIFNAEKRGISAIAELERDWNHALS